MFAASKHYSEQRGLHYTTESEKKSNSKTRMWANAQGDGHPAEYRWHPLFNAAKFG